MDDIDEAVYPATINEDLVDYGHVPDDVDDAGGADAAAFLGLGNVTEAAAAPVPPVSLGPVDLSVDLLSGIILLKSWMINACVLLLFASFVAIDCLLNLLLALVICLGIKMHVKRKLIMLKWFKLGLL